MLKEGIRFSSETKTPVESGCLVVKGVGQQGSYPGLFGNPQCAPDRILEEPSSNTATLMAERHAKPNENHDRNRVISHTFPDTVGTDQRHSLSQGAGFDNRSSKPVLGCGGRSSNPKNS